MRAVHHLTLALLLGFMGHVCAQEGKTASVSPPIKSPKAEAKKGMSIPKDEAQVDMASPTENDPPVLRCVVDASAWCPVTAQTLKGQDCACKFSVNGPTRLGKTK